MNNDKGPADDGRASKEGRDGMKGKGKKKQRCWRRVPWFLYNTNLGIGNYIQLLRWTRRESVIITQIEWKGKFKGPVDGCVRWRGRLITTTRVGPVYYYYYYYCRMVHNSTRACDPTNTESQKLHNPTSRQYPDEPRMGLGCLESRESRSRGGGDAVTH